MTRFAVILALLLPGCGFAPSHPAGRTAASPVSRTAALTATPTAAAAPASTQPSVRAAKVGKLVSVVFQSDPTNRTPANPFGWYPDFDTPDKADKAIDAAVARSLEMGCYGILFWDWGGAPDDVTPYRGRPWLSGRDPAQIARWRKKITDAGLAWGGTVRPQAVDLPDSGAVTRWSPDHETILREAVAYGRRELGWTLFYVDTNWKSATDNGQGNLIPPDVFARLATDYGGIYVFPEGARADYESLPPNVAPIRWFPNPQQNRTPPLVSVPPGQKMTDKLYEDLVTSFRNGAWGLVSATWPDNPANAIVQAAFAAAKVP